MTSRQRLASCSLALVLITGAAFLSESSGPATALPVLRDAEPSSPRASIPAELESASPLPRLRYPGERGAVAEPEEGARIAGRLLDAAGEPVFGATLAVIPPAGEPSEWRASAEDAVAHPEAARTGEKGEFSLVVPRGGASHLAFRTPTGGLYLVEAVHAGTLHLRIALPVEVLEGDEHLQTVGEVRIRGHRSVALALEAMSLQASVTRLQWRSAATDNAAALGEGPARPLAGTAEEVPEPAVPALEIWIAKVQPPTPSQEGGDPTLNPDVPENGSALPAPPTSWVFHVNSTSDELRLRNAESLQAMRTALTVTAAGGVAVTTEVEPASRSRLQSMMNPTLISPGRPASISVAGPDSTSSPRPPSCLPVIAYDEKTQARFYVWIFP